MAWPALPSEVQDRIHALLTPADVARARCVCVAWRRALAPRRAAAAFLRVAELRSPAAACDQCCYCWALSGHGRALLAVPWDGGDARCVLALPLSVGEATLAADSEVHVAPGHAPGHLVLAGRDGERLVLAEVTADGEVRPYSAHRGEDTALTGVRSTGRSSFMLELQTYSRGDSCVLLARSEGETVATAVRVAVSRAGGAYSVDCEWLDARLRVMHSASAACEQAPSVRSAERLVTVHDQTRLRMFLCGQELPCARGVLWCEPLSESYVAICGKAGLAVWDVAHGRPACRPVACDHERLCRLPGGGISMCLDDTWWVTHQALLLRPLVRAVPPPAGKLPARRGALGRRPASAQFERVAVVERGTAVLESSVEGGVQRTEVALAELAAAKRWPAFRHACRIMLVAEVGDHTVLSVQCALLMVSTWVDLLQRAMLVYRTHADTLPGYKVLRVSYGGRTIGPGDTPAALGFETALNDLHIVLVSEQ